MNFCHKWNCAAVTLKVLAMYVLMFMLSSQDGATPLHSASYNGHCQVAELLLSKGADVNLPVQVYIVFSRARHLLV